MAVHILCRRYKGLYPGLLPKSVLLPEVLTSRHRRKLLERHQEVIEAVLTYEEHVDTKTVEKAFDAYMACRVGTAEDEIRLGQEQDLGVYIPP